MTANIRDSIRTNILNTKAATKQVTLFGSEVELRQPTIDDILNAESASKGDQVYMMLIRYTFVPGTDERIFEEGDLDSLRALPMSSDIMNYMEAMTGLLGIDKGDLLKAIEDNTKST